MRPLSTIEEWLERLVSSVFKPPGAEGLPERLVRAIDVQVDANVRTGLDRVYAPNVVTVRLTHSVEGLDEVAGQIERELEGHIVRRAKDREYSFTGPVRVRIETGPAGSCDSTESEFGVTCSFDETAAPLPPLEGTQLYSVAAVPKIDNEETTKVFLRPLVGDAPEPEHRPDPPAALVRLRVVEGPDAGDDFEFGETHGTIGRRKDCIVELSDRNVSRVHAEIEVSPAQTVIYDRGSTNGTLVNGRRITRRKLNNGDRIGLGTSEIVYFDLRPTEPRRK